MRAELPLLHKASIYVLLSDAAQRPERRHTLFVFVVKKRTRPDYVRGVDGKPVRAPAEYPELVSQVCVDGGFSPVEPADVLRDPVGADLTLVQGDA